MPKRLLVIDIDGLRQDVFHGALAAGVIPNLASLVDVHLDPISTFPSITFCAQSTIFTGANPARHGIVGNQFFNRFLDKPRFYAFDVGDALAYDDAVLTFTGKQGLVGQVMDTRAQTLYERAARRGLTSTVVYQMVSRGASRWIKPSLVDIARFTKGGGLFGMSAQAYDTEMMDKTLRSLHAHGAPDVLTVYFMGLDHTSHHDGPGSQYAYLTRFVDAQVGRLLERLREMEWLEGAFVVVVSDHGQIEVKPDDQHSLRLSFPFDREMGDLFDALGLDVHDKPREGPDTDAVVASNGGMAHVYLRHEHTNWDAAPRFDQDILRVAKAFWEAHETGRYSEDLRGALRLVLVRNAQAEGWDAGYRALTADGRLVEIETALAEQPGSRAVGAGVRLRALAGPLSGDILLVSSVEDGFYFGGPVMGVHGGLHLDESMAVGSLGWIGASTQQRDLLRETVERVVSEQRAHEGRQHTGLADLLPVIEALLFV